MLLSLTAALIAAAVSAPASAEAGAMGSLRCQTPAAVGIAAALAGDVLHGLHRDKRVECINVSLLFVQTPVW